MSELRAIMARRRMIVDGVAPEPCPSLSQLQQIPAVKTALPASSSNNTPLGCGFAGAAGQHTRITALEAPIQACSIAAPRTGTRSIEAGCSDEHVSSLCDHTLCVSLASSSPINNDVSRQPPPSTVGFGYSDPAGSNKRNGGNLSTTTDEGQVPLGEKQLKKVEGKVDHMQTHDVGISSTNSYTQDGVSHYGATNVFDDNGGTALEKTICAVHSVASASKKVSCSPPIRTPLKILDVPQPKFAASENERHLFKSELNCPDSESKNIDNGGEIMTTPIMDDSKATCIFDPYRPDIERKLGVSTNETQKEHTSVSVNESQLLNIPNATNTAEPEKTRSLSSVVLGPSLQIVTRENPLPDLFELSLTAMPVGQQPSNVSDPFIPMQPDSKPLSGTDDLLVVGVPSIIRDDIDDSTPASATSVTMVEPAEQQKAADFQAEDCQDKMSCKATRAPAHDSQHRDSVSNALEASMEIFQNSCRSSLVPASFNNSAIDSGSYNLTFSPSKNSSCAEGFDGLNRSGLVKKVDDYFCSKVEEKEEGSRMSRYDTPVRPRRRHRSTVSFDDPSLCGSFKEKPQSSIESEIDAAVRTNPENVSREDSTRDEEKGEDFDKQKSYKQSSDKGKKSSSSQSTKRSSARRRRSAPEQKSPDRARQVEEREDNRNTGENSGSKQSKQSMPKQPTTRSKRKEESGESDRLARKEKAKRLEEKKASFVASLMHNSVQVCDFAIKPIPELIHLTKIDGLAASPQTPAKSAQQTRQRTIRIDLDDSDSSLHDDSEALRSSTKSARSTQQSQRKGKEKNGQHRKSVSGTEDMLRKDSIVRSEERPMRRLSRTAAMNRDKQNFKESLSRKNSNVRSDERPTRHLSRTASMNNDRQISKSKEDATRKASNVRSNERPTRHLSRESSMTRDRQRRTTRRSSIGVTTELDRRLCNSSIYCQAKPSKPKIVESSQKLGLNSAGHSKPSRHCRRGSTGSSKGSADEAGTIYRRSERYQQCKT